MKRLITLLIIIPLFGMSQTNYELSFNSATLDYVEMPNTSSVIANKTAFSISCWVNPQSNTNHGGIMGFRNNSDADFYLLQMQNTTTIEARFRNSSGANYDILATNILDLGQWQHLAFTYDGSYIRLYKNGVIVNSIAANGTITQSNQSFKLGSLDWQGSGFHLIGKIDEARLWDVALSQTEIQNWMCSEIDASHPNYSNLMGYWNLNEGIGVSTDDQTTNGNNGTILGGTVWQTSSSCLAVVVLCGDVNEDGVVDQTDVTDINNYITGVIVPVFNLWAADVNCDGVINVLDITLLNSFISGTGTSPLNCCSPTIFGCTDILACNYNSIATIDDSSCVYLDIIAIPTSVSCFGYSDGSIVATATGGVLPFQYSLGAGLSQTNGTFSNLSAGTYYIDVTDINGCTSNQTVVITEPPILSISVDSTNETSALNDGSATAIINGGTIPYTYIWNNGGITNALNNLPPGLYTVTVTDNNGCVISGSTFVNAYSATNVMNIKNINRTLIKIANILGQETLYRKNTTLFYIYNDGTVEKKIIIE